MKENTTHILCKKTGIDFLFFIDEQELSIEEVCEQVGNNPANVISFETIENEKLLLSGYLVYQNKQSFIRRLNQSARAKVKVNF